MRYTGFRYSLHIITNKLFFVLQTCQMRANLKPSCITTSVFTCSGPHATHMLRQVQIIFLLCEKVVVYCLASSQ